MDNTRKTILIGLMIFAALATSTSAITWLPQISKSQEVTTTANETIAASPDVPEQAANPDSFANVEVVQDADTVVIVVSQIPVPDEPIIVVPPSPGNENGSVIMPPPTNETVPPDNVTIIEPGGNITEIPGNVTIIGDNETAIITDENQSITETPGNVTIIDPPLPEPCGCPPAAGNETAGEAPGIPPVIVTPAPGQNVTTNVTEPTEPAPAPPSENVTEPAPPAGNVTVPGETPPGNATEPSPEVPPAGNETAPPAGNATGNATAPIEVPSAGNETTEVDITGNVSTTEPLPPDTEITGNVTAPEEEPPQATQLPASVPQQQTQPPLFWINYGQ